MPVSPKRKKKGKPVHRAQPAAADAAGEGASQAPDVAEHQRNVERRVGKPRNPFVEKQGPKASQRGR
jgi:hypothetical protein